MSGCTHRSCGVMRTVRCRAVPTGRIRTAIFGADPGYRWHGSGYQRGVSPELQRAFERENWAKLSKEAFWHARRLVSYRWWRGNSDGVLPEGYDPESIANEAVAELFNGKCRLKPDYKQEELGYELRRAGL